MALRVFAFAIAIALTSSAAVAGPETVDIPDGDLSLHTMLYRPDGPGPFPAVVALHDCGGLTKRPNTEAQLYSVWANKLVADGFVVLFPDSFGSRGLGSQCRERHRNVHASRERVTDANAARLWLQQQSYVRPDHISLLGWSNGAAAVLWTVRLTTPPHPESADFRSAVAFYPSCGRLREAAWSASSVGLTIGRPPQPASRWWPAREAAARACRSSSIRMRITNSTEPILQFGCEPALSTLSILPAARMAARIRPRATMRSRAFRNGWRDDLVKTPRRNRSARRQVTVSNRWYAYQQCRWP
jgi:dienelactone hydrolase